MSYRVSFCCVAPAAAHQGSSRTHQHRSAGNGAVERCEDDGVCSSWTPTSPPPAAHWPGCLKHGDVCWRDVVDAQERLLGGQAAPVGCQGVAGIVHVRQHHGCGELQGIKEAQGMSKARRTSHHSMGHALGWSQWEHDAVQHEAPTHDTGTAASNPRHNISGQALHNMCAVLHCSTAITAACPLPGTAATCRKSGVCWAHGYVRELVGDDGQDLSGLDVLSCHCGADTVHVCYVYVHLSSCCSDPFYQLTVAGICHIACLT